MTSTTASSAIKIGDTVKFRDDFSDKVKGVEFVVDRIIAATPDNALEGDFIGLALKDDPRRGRNAWRKDLVLVEAKVSAIDKTLSSIQAANDLKAAYKAKDPAVLAWPYLADEFDRLADIIEGFDPHFAGDLQDIAADIRKGASK